RFLERFPDLETWARALPRAVREAWDGLAYYARARNLHSLAKRVTGRSVAGRGVAGDGVPTLPDDPEELVKLPGIGPYTAGAVASFAYEKSVPAVDTNVRRVLLRVFFGDDRQRLTRQRANRRRGGRLPHRRRCPLKPALLRRRRPTPSAGAGTPRKPFGRRACAIRLRCKSLTPSVSRCRTNISTASGRATRSGRSSMARIAGPMWCRLGGEPASRARARDATTPRISDS